MKYTSLQKYLAASLLIGTSVAGYKFLRSILPLPSIDTILRMLRKLKVKPGISEINVRNLKMKVDAKDPKKNQVFLLLDEMSLRKGLGFDQASDTIVGFQDTGLSRSKSLATHALVVMAVGFIQKWKYPLGYFFSSSTMKAEEVKDILEESVIKMEEAGFEVLGVTTDQGSNFEKTFKVLGVTPHYPKFQLGNKIYFNLNRIHMLTWQLEYMVIY